MFIEFLNKEIAQIELNIEASTFCNAEEEEINYYERILTCFQKVRDLFDNSKISIHYLNHFRGNIQEITNYLPFKHFDNHEEIRKDLESNYVSLSDFTSNNVEPKVNQLIFTLDFFEKLGFFNDNIVAIGANGSGKTSLSDKLKNYLNKSGVVISAQRILVIPTFSGISNISKTQSNLGDIQRANKTNKTTYSTENNGNAYSILVNLGGEFKTLLDNLLAENSMEEHKCVDKIRKGEKDVIAPCTKLNTAFEIWNTLIEHRTIKCDDGINIVLESNDSKPYPAYQMSDGEKVVLYHIAQVLQAPRDGFIIVDEPEMYLHKTIVKKLWNILEKERQDCIFIYLTHDLDLATSRIGAKKVWIKSFTHPDKWDFENIPENEMPEPLVMELLGSRKNILFCEGRVGSYDEQIYNILFPDFTIKPLGSCSDVINYTKAFNKLPSMGTQAYGVIDADFQNDERIESLRNENIYPLRVAEVENLLLDEDFLRKLATQLMKEEELDELKSKVISQLEKR